MIIKMIIDSLEEKNVVIDFVREEQDIVKEVHITTSPEEYLIISAALKQFIENHNNHDSDIEIAKQMRKVIEDYGNSNTNQNCDFDS